MEKACKIVLLHCYITEKKKLVLVCYGSAEFFFFHLS